jgi:hypothetical protein
MVRDNLGCKNIHRLGEDSHGIFAVSEIGYTHGLHSEGEDVANANLISAAPDLLAACKMALSKMQAAWDDTGVCPEFDADDLAPLRAAITKAEGN